MYFSFWSLRWDSDLFRSHMLDPPPQDAIVAFMKGLRLGSLTLHAPQTTRGSTCDRWKPSAWDRPVTYIQCLSWSSQKKTSETSCVVLHQLNQPKLYLENVSCSLGQNFWIVSWMKSFVKILEAVHLYCRIPVQDTPFMLHVISKWGLQTLQEVMVIMTAPRLSVVHVDFFKCWCYNPTGTVISKRILGLLMGSDSFKKKNHHPTISKYHRMLRKHQRSLQVGTVFREEVERGDWYCFGFPYFPWTSFFFQFVFFDA